MVLLGGHAWFYLGGPCVVLFGGACVVLLGGHAWFYLGGHAWFFRGACMVFPEGGVPGFFSFFGYNEIRSMSGRYASYWNAFLLPLLPPTNEVAERNVFIGVCLFRTEGVSM